MFGSLLNVTGLPFIFSIYIQDICRTTHRQISNPLLNNHSLAYKCLAIKELAVKKRKGTIVIQRKSELYRLHRARDDRLLFYVHRSEAAYWGRGLGAGGRGRKSEGSTADTARKRPERPWTAARTMEVLRRCPLAIAQRLVHCAIAVSTAVLGQSQRQCPLHCC